jgi:hypothetical protein
MDIIDGHIIGEKKDVKKINEILETIFVYNICEIKIKLDLKRDMNKKEMNYRKVTKYTRKQGVRNMIFT